jgi:hypothetical protein
MNVNGGLDLSYCDGDFRSPAKRGQRKNRRQTTIDIDKLETWCLVSIKLWPVSAGDFFCSSLTTEGYVGQNLCGRDLALISSALQILVDETYLPFLWISIRILASRLQKKFWRRLFTYCAGVKDSSPVGRVANHCSADIWNDLLESTKPMQAKKNLVRSYSRLGLGFDFALRSLTCRKFSRRHLGSSFYWNCQPT